MVRQRTSVVTIVVIALVTATTLLLGTLGLFTYRSNRLQQWDNLHHDHAILADHLSIALTLPVWNFDRDQIDRIIESVMKDNNVAGIVVYLADRNSSIHARTRDEQWGVRVVDGEFPVEGLLAETRNITANNEILGILKVFITPRYIEAELRKTRFTMIALVLILDAILVLTLYLLLWKLVLQPLKQVELYASAISSGSPGEEKLDEKSFFGELESLRSSLKTMVTLLNARYTDLQKSDNELHWKSAFLEAQVDSALDGILVVNSSGKKILQNHRMNELWKIPQYIIENKDDAEQLRFVTDKTKNPKQFVDKVTYLYSHPDEVSRDEIELIDGTVLDRYSSPVRDKAGNHYGRIWTFRDITERKQAEVDRFRLMHDIAERIKELTVLHGTAHLLQGERPFNRELLAEMVALLPPGWQYPEICEARITYADLEAITAGWRETRWKQKAQFATSDGQTGTIEVVYREDRPPAAEGPFLIEERNLIESLADMLTAHLERRLAEDILRVSEDHFRHLVNSSPSVIYASTLEGRKCIYVSETLTRMTGYEPQEMLTNSELWFSCVHPGDIKQTLSALESQMQRGEGTLEYRFRKKDGVYLWINDNFRFIRDASGKPVEVVGSWTDITASRRTEEQLAQAQKMEALGQLTGGIAHDFNNRLTVIIGNLELLQSRLGNDPATQEQLKSVLSAADGAASLTRELLTFSRQQVLEVAVININDLITSMRNMMQRTLGEIINVVISPEADLWPVRTDRHMLENVLLNLAINARDAMPNGGQLTFESHNVRLDETFVETHSYLKPGDYVLLSVSDTGQGMSEEIKRRVFEPFFTTKEKSKGTGLGLAMVYGFVKQSAGHIEIYSEPGHGTSFNIYLPKDMSTAVADAPSPLAATGEEDAVIRDKTILLVEDEATVRNIVVTLLGNLGCRVLSADGGPAALEIFAKTPDIDLLFTDITMPGGMTGFELAAKMRERVPELRVLYTSGYAPQAAADRRTIEHPNDFWLAKPYRFKTLKSLIIKAFGTQLTISGE